MTVRRKRILRLRSGHLANFSGGAGYMPFVTMHSVPTSIFCWIVSFLLLRRAARKMRQPADHEEIHGPREDVAGFMARAGRHFLVFLGITVLATVALYPFAVSKIYDMEPGLKSVAFFLAVGPFFALIVSMITLMALTWFTGVRRRNLALAGLAYALVLIATILPGGGYLYLFLAVYWVVMEFLSSYLGVLQ